MIARHQYIEAVTRLLKRNPVVAILGARQVRAVAARQITKIFG